jgi:exopolyphosphatase/guanosine-5'-triphosphate,3'-diphosphate pyrophosphatase
VSVGAIDIGTNTVLLLVAELRGGELVPIVDRARIVRLGEGVDRTRRLLPQAVERTLGALHEYAREARSLGVERLGAVGTSALRDAQGGADFLDRAEEILGVRPQVIDGDTEAELTFRGALSGLGLVGDVCVFDVGGGSTEVITGRAASSPALGAARSLDVGSVRLFERHVQSDPPSRDELRRVAEDVDQALAHAPLPSPGARLVGVAGTVTTLAAIELGLAEYEPARVHGHVLSRRAVDTVAERLGSVGVEERRKLAGLEPKRADVIVVGAEIVRRVMAWSGAPELVVSDRGVRFGLAESLLAR